MEAAYGCNFVHVADQIKTASKCPKHNGQVVELQVRFTHGNNFDKLLFAYVTEMS